jgi:RNA polymerase sigma factor (sigma-70 family)
VSDEWPLIERARAGESEARDRLVAGYLDDVYAVAYRVLGDRELAQDAAQDAFVNALGALHRFRGDASFRTWLLRIAVNAARSLARRRTRRREVALAAAVAVPAGGEDPASLAIAQTEGERVRGALQRLPEKQRLCVSLRVYRGLSYAEIAAIVGGTEGAARVNYHLGIKRLREVLP